MTGFFRIEFQASHHMRGLENFCPTLIGFNTASHHMRGLEMRSIAVIQTLCASHHMRGLENAI